ncbi:MAG: nucleotide exchange factor GrpE [bacterium]
MADLDETKKIEEIEEHRKRVSADFDEYYKAKKQPDRDDLEARLIELSENWKRALADYKNLERRVAEERLDFVKFANATLLLKLFVVYDSLRVGLKHNKEALEPIFNQLKKVLESEGLKVVEIKEGADFDPERMEVVEGSTGEKVGRVVQEGFILDGRIIRPARVELINSKS